MTEQQIRDTAEAFRLQVLKRITTGSNTRHFATFELSGLTADVMAAMPTIRAQACKGMASMRHVDNPEHPEHGKPYIAIESVWCEVEDTNATA